MENADNKNKSGEKKKVDGKPGLKIAVPEEGKQPEDQQNEESKRESEGDDSNDSGKADNVYRDYLDGIDDFEEQRLVNLVIVDLNGREINLKMVQYELILELREFLSEHAYTCFFTNYYLEHNGAKLSDYTDLAELDLETHPRIFMRTQLYDERSARVHIKRTEDILERPCVLSSQQSSAEEDQLNQIASKGKIEGLTQEKIDEQQGEVFKEFQAKQHAKAKLLYETFSKMVEDDKQNKYILPHGEGAAPMGEGKAPVEKEELKESEADDAATTSPQSVLKDLYSTTIQRNISGEKNYEKCIESIQFSEFNPPPPQRKLVGDLFYLTVKTLDCGDKGITCCVNGFYVNDNVEKGVFSPLPTQKKNAATGKSNAAFSYTLIGCLNQISESFGKNLFTYLSQLLNTEPYLLTQPQLKVHHWGTFEQDNKKNVPCDQHTMSEVVTPLYGLNPRGMRDWNEEYQVVKDFSKGNMGQRCQRDRALQKIYNDFLQAATEGAIAVVKGSLSPLNPNENKNSQVFVYNYIFFSFTLDQMDNFRDLATLENNPSWSQANHDLCGLRALQNLEIEGLCYLATTVVNYRGHRIICQSIIPGILNNTDLSTLAEYGTVDERRTIHATEQFHNLMKQVCEKMNIQVNKVIDSEDKEVEIAGCVEIKGIRGTDKRCYFVDLQGLFPRDANYQGEDYHTCCIRQELLVLYQRNKNLEYAQEAMEKFDEEIEKERREREPKIAEGAEATEEQKKALHDLLTELQQKKMQKFNELLKESHTEVYNTNVFKNVKLAMSEEEVKEQEDKLKDIARFLKEEAIPQMIKTMAKNEGVPTDSFSLKEFLHQNGVNIRYIGYIADQIKEKNLSQLKYILEKEVVVRCMKHLMAKYLRQCESDELIAAVASHVLNCLLAPKEFIKKMDDGLVKNEPVTIKNVADFNIIREQDSDDEFALPVIAHTVGEPGTEGQAKPAMSKREKKRQRRAAKGGEGEGAAEDGQDGAGKKPNMSLNDLLFAGGLEPVEFDAYEIFNELDIAMNVCESRMPESLQLTPKKLYAELKQLAEKRYQYMVLPKKMMQLRSLESSNNKMALLRDICISIGLTLNFSTHQNDDRQFILENDGDKLREQLSAHVLKQRNAQNQGQKQKKKGAHSQQQNQILPDEELFTYDNLPFQLMDIADFFPILKKLDVNNKDANQMMTEAKNAVAEGQLEKALDCYGQTVNILLQITGPMNTDIAAAIAKMANIQHRLGDIFQAIELQTRSLIIQEKLIGFDSPIVAYSYSNLALYYHQSQYHSKGFECMHKSLKVLQSVCGDNHPDISAISLNLGLMYQDVENHNAAIECFKYSLSKNEALYGHEHIQVASNYQAIAHAYYLMQNYRAALENQEKSHLIIKQVMPEDSHYLKQSQDQMHQFLTLSVQNDRQKKMEKIGAGGRSIGDNKAKLTEKEKEELVKRQRFEQYLRRLGEGQVAGQHHRLRAGNFDRAGFLDMVEQRNRAQYGQALMQQAQEQQQRTGLNPAFTQPLAAGESPLTRAAHEAGLAGLAGMPAGGAAGEDDPGTAGGKNKKKKRKK